MKKIMMYNGVTCVTVNPETFLAGTKGTCRKKGYELLGIDIDQRPLPAIHTAFGGDTNDPKTWMLTTPADVYEQLVDDVKEMENRVDELMKMNALVSQFIQEKYDESFQFDKIVEFNREKHIMDPIVFYTM